MRGRWALFVQAAGWLRRNRVLLPGVTVLARQVAAAREIAEARVYAALAAATRSVDPGLPERLAVLGAGRVGVDDIPANRQQVLARTGLGSKASAVARLGEPKRTATLVAVVRHLEAAAAGEGLQDGRPRGPGVA